MAPFTRVQVEKCGSCLAYYPANFNHQCPPVTITVAAPKKFRKILPAVSIENKVSLLSSNNNVGVNKLQHREDDYDLTCSLISAIKVRPPLFDHRMVLTERSESIKNKLWNEVYAELKGQITIEELKKKWKYLKEKYVRERQKPRKIENIKDGRRTKWLHYNQMSFLEEVITLCPDKKTTSILNSNLNNNYSVNSPQSITTAKEETRKEKNNHNSQQHLLNEHKVPRPLLPAELIEDLCDTDIAFANYLMTLMKGIPLKKRKKLQTQMIASAVTAQDSE